MQDKKINANENLSDKQLENVSGGMRPGYNANPCPKCGQYSEYTGSGNEYKCPKCGCRWDSLTGEILN